MLSSQILQKTISQMKTITCCDMAIWDRKKKCLADTGICADEQEREMGIQVCMRAAEEGQAYGVLCGTGRESLFVFSIDEYNETAAVLVIKGLKQEAEVIGRLCKGQIEGLQEAYRERQDKNHFIQHLLLNTMPGVDIYNRARRLNIAVEERRIVFMIEPKKEEDSIVMETMKGLYATSPKDFITALDEGHIIFIKTLLKTDGEKEIIHVANTIKDTLNAEAMVKVRVSCGTVVEELGCVPQSYREAFMALEIGHIFYAERNILNYGSLGIGKLIYQLPTALCEDFLKEVLRGNAMAQFDKEMLATIYQFFGNNLNVSETARQLYIHRNTLVYRLEKIQKSVGLDVRVFEDAMIFKIALMVSNFTNFLHSENQGIIMSSR